MDRQTEHTSQIPDSLYTFVIIVAVAGALLITPLSINNFIQGRIFLGTLSMIVVLVMSVNAWTVYRHKHYYPNLILFILAPVIIIFLVFSIRHQKIIGILWSYPAVIAFYFMLPVKKAWLANALLVLVTFPVIWDTFDPELNVRIFATLTSVSIFSAVSISVISNQQQKLQKLAHTDYLTGVLNRVRLQEILEEAVQQHDRTNIPMSLLMFDLDNFKEANDRLGHAAGDKVLKSIARYIQTRCRNIDKVFRIGGEEFLLFVYNTKLEEAKEMAEELRSKIELLQVFPEVTTTVSIGVATLEPEENWRSWMKRSDDNLYSAKAAGRNKVVG